MYKFKKFSLYRIRDRIDFNLVALQRSLSEFSFEPCSGEDRYRSGWCSFSESSEQLFRYVSGVIFLRYCAQSMKVPSGARASMLSVREKEYYQEHGCRPSGDDHQAILDAIDADLVSKSVPVNKFVDGYIDLSRNLVVIGAVSPSDCDLWLNGLRKAIGSLKVLPVSSELERSVDGVVGDWLSARDKWQEGFRPSGRIILAHMDDKKDVFKQESVWSSWEPVEAAIEAGYSRVVEFEMLVPLGKLGSGDNADEDDFIEVLMTDKSVFKKVCFNPDVWADSSYGEDSLANLDADIVLMSGEVRRFWDWFAGVFEVCDVYEGDLCTVVDGVEGADQQEQLDEFDSAALEGWRSGVTLKVSGGTAAVVADDDADQDLVDVPSLGWLMSEATIKERVATLLAALDGEVNALQIARRLGISYPTIRTPLCEMAQDGQVHRRRDRSGVFVYRDIGAVVTPKSALRLSMSKLGRVPVVAGV